MKTTNWFAASKKGLANIASRIIERRGAGAILGELYQNAVDAGATSISIQLENRGSRVAVTAIDNGTGFANLDDAFTVFAPSEKTNNPEQRGRFNLGEKLVLSLANVATITTTGGMITFNPGGKTVHRKPTNITGTVFNAIIPTTRPATFINEMISFAAKLIIPAGVSLIVNGDVIPQRTRFASFAATLPTEIGVELRRTNRNTTVDVYETTEPGWLFEMGIPVVETGDKYDLDVMQKIPLTVERDNVLPSFLKAIRVATLNALVDKLNEDDTTAAWVRDAVANPAATVAATQTVLTKQFGDRVVAANPFQPESNAKAAAAGYVVLPRNAISTDARRLLYERDQLQTSTDIFPPPTTTPMNPVQDFTPFMTAVANVSRYIAKTAGIETNVRFVEHNCSMIACYSPGSLTFNLFHAKSFSTRQQLVELVIHELGHHWESNHLSAGYYDALCRVGAALTLATIKDGGTLERLLDEFALAFP